MPKGPEKQLSAGRPEKLKAEKSERDALAEKIFEGTIDELLGEATLRDWFAGQALAAMGAERFPPSEIASDCYAIADAMLKRRDI